MFEKEAKKWVRENTHTEYSASFGEIEVEPSAEKGFQKGAEFGYNKALEEIGDLRDCCNCKHWHYSTRSLSYYCDKTDRIDDCERQCYRCEHWNH